MTTLVIQIIYLKWGKCVLLDSIRLTNYISTEMLFNIYVERKKKPFNQWDDIRELINDERLFKNLCFGLKKIVTYFWNKNLNIFPKNVFFALGCFK